MRTLTRLVVLAFPLTSLACPGTTKPPPPEPPPSPVAEAEPEEPVVVHQSKSGLGFRMTEIDATAQPPKSRLAKGVPLSPEDEKRVLDRMPPMEESPDDEKGFALRDKSQPPPKTGSIVSDAFPPPIAKSPPAVGQAGPLSVTRHLPEGAVTLAPHLSVSFSQPMVAVTSHGDIGAETPPVRLIPTPPGKWRWIGTQTLLFEPTDRFPMATDYEVEVPAGTRSQTGGSLAAPTKWTFTTPPPKVVASHPHGGSEPLAPVMFLAFDQRIDRQAVLSALSVTAGSSRVAVRLATDDEVEADASVRALAKRAEKGRWLAFRAPSDLPGGTSVSVVVPEGTPSAEGPKRTTKAQSFSFSTFGPMVATGIRCGWWGGDCPPLVPLQVHFSNAIEARRFEKASLVVEPEIPGLKVVASGHDVVLSGRTKGRTTYKVTAKAGVIDRFGQSSAADKTFEITISPAEPVLFREERPMAVQDPAAGATLPVYTVNHGSLRAKLYAVTPSDWDKYLTWRRDWDYEGKRREPPGVLLSNKVVTVKSAPDELVETSVDLSVALKGGVGQIIALVEPTTPPKKDHPRESMRTWLQVTKLGVDVFADPEQVVGWVSALDSGAPVAGAEVSLLGAPGAAATSGSDGLARIAAGGTTSVVARLGGDVAMLVEGYRSYRHGDELAWFVFDDRRMYRPAEEVHVKGFLRIREGGLGKDVRGLPPGRDRAVSFVVRDARGVEIAKGKDARVDEQGGFDLSFTLPKTPNLGHASVSLELSGAPASNAHHTHTFQIEEFRRPEFEVTVHASEGPHKVGRHATLTTAAKYYAGGGLAEAPVDWRVTSSIGRFVPPNRTGFAWGQSPERRWFSFRARNEDKPKTETLSSHTTGSGEHRVRVDFDAIEPSFPLSLAVETSVTDVNRQTWAAQTSVLVHPGDLYVGLRPEKTFVRAGDQIAVDVVVSDLDGLSVPGKKVTVRSARLDWDQVAGEMKELEKDVESCELTSLADVVRCQLRTREAGRYRLLATVVDQHGRKSQTELFLYVLGDGMPAERGLERNAVRVVADKAEYRPGETAELLVVAPFAPAEGVVSLGRQGLAHLARFSITSKTETVRVQIPDGSHPVIAARVDLVGSATRENLAGDLDERLPKRPAFASGSVDLAVPPKERTLSVKATPREAAVEPGGTTTVEVELRDAKGVAVPGAEVALVVADEAVLALSGYQLPDPVSVFFDRRATMVSNAQNRDDVLLGRLDESRASSLRPKAKATKNGGGIGLGSIGTIGHGSGGGGRGMGMAAKASPAMAPPAPSATAAPERKRSADADDAKKKDEAPRKEEAESSASGGEGQSKKPIAMRKDLNPLALWAPAVLTDQAGRALVNVKLPDSVTRYRVMAVAVAGERSFGGGESTITARLPLMVRPSAPRFLNYGDRFDLPVVVQNQSGAPMTVDLVARTSNASLPEGGGRRVVVPPNDRVEVRVPAAAAKPGTARFQVGVASGRFADAAEVSLPVWTPATTEAFATYGTIDEGAIAQPVKMPTGVVTDFGGLDVQTSSTAVSALTDAVLYLIRYPYECNEQISSRVLALAALRDVLTAFGSKEIPKPAVLADSMKRDLAKLRSRQRYDGGFSFWGPDRESWAYLTIHVMHALSRAKDKGYAVPEDTVARGKSYLRSIEAHIPSWYPPEVRRSIVAYALWTRKLLGDRDAPKARAVLAEAGGADKMPLEALGWLLPVLSGDDASNAEVEAIRKHLANRVSETAGAAHFATSYSDGGHLLLHSDRRADGLILEAMIGDQPKSELIPKIVTGLLAHRKAGRWYNTQENAFILLALDRYFNTFEKATPDFVARAWLGERYAGDHAFKGRTTETHQIKVPMRVVSEVAATQTNLVIQKDGPGRLYYRVGMDYAPSDLRPPPAEHGFTITRAYEAVDAPDDVKRDPDGSFRIKAGSKVRVRVTMVAPSRRYHVALVDPLPAGLEPMNPALAVTGSVPTDPKKAESGTPWWWSRAWYEHQNMRDERVEAFSSLLWEGVYDYTYVARATTPGTFVAPPPKAEEMYSPETFGRAAGDRVIVE